MKKPAIPSVPGDYDPRVLQALKINIDMITGAIGGPIAPLPMSAALPDVITKVNEIITRLNKG